MNPSETNVVADGRGGWVEGDHGPAAPATRTIRVHLDVEVPAPTGRSSNRATLESAVAQVEAALIAGATYDRTPDILGRWNVVLAEEV